MTDDPSAVRTKYDSEYSMFAGQPGYPSEARYATTLFELLRRRGLIPATVDASLLDLGCGLGFKTRALAESFRSACGVDFSAAAIEMARSLNDLASLRFEVLDVESGSLERRFDVVTAFGISLLNVRDESEYARLLASFATRFTNPRGGLLVAIGQSDFSGRVDDGWYNHTHRALKRIRGLAGATQRTHLYLPGRDPRSYRSFGAEYALRELAKPVLRRRRDYCLIVEA